MAASNFSLALQRVLVYEGGYSNHPKDPGGVTLEGVIQRVDDAYRQRRGLAPRPLVPAMRGTPAWIAERDAIYRLQYWNKIRGDDLPIGVDLVLFDAAVNSGPTQAIKWLQRALGCRVVDGSLSEVTMSKLDLCEDNDKLIADICARRLAFLQQLGTWPTFKDGWSKRVANVNAAGQAQATGYEPHAAPPHLAELGGGAKANDTDLSEAPLGAGVGSAGSTGGMLTTGVLDTVQTASVSIQPLADSIQIVKWIVLTLSIIVAGVTLYGVYRSYKTQRARNGEDVVAVPAEMEA